MGSPLDSAVAFHSGEGAQSVAPKPAGVLARRPSVLLWFALTVAFVAAAIADPLVEAVSNAGVFGSQTLTDHSSFDVIPMLVVGFAGAFLWTLLQVKRLLSGANSKAPWIQRSALALDDRTVAAFYPAIFVSQIGILLGMETLEQLIVRGHVLGPLVWLGGPIAFSLATHAAISLAVAATLQRILLRCSAAIVHVVRFITRLFTLLAPRSVVSFARSTESFGSRILAPLPCRIGERAPPIPA